MKKLFACPTQICSFDNSSIIYLLVVESFPLSSDLLIKHFHSLSFSIISRDTKKNISVISQMILRRLILMVGDGETKYFKVFVSARVKQKRFRLHEWEFFALFFRFQFEYSMSMSTLLRSLHLRSRLVSIETKLSIVASASVVSWNLLHNYSNFALIAIDCWIEFNLTRTQSGGSGYRSEQIEWKLQFAMQISELT